MNNITNTKIQNLTPAWRYFPGFSLLFDNPGKDNYLRGRNGISRIDCKLGGSIGFYNIVERIRRLPSLPTSSNSLCLLPFPSFHVTVWDGANAENLQDFNPEASTKFKELFASFPISIGKAKSDLGLIQQSQLLSKNDWALKLNYKALEKWGNQALVIRLEAADDKSIAIFSKIQALRKAFNKEFQERYGFSAGFRDTFTPHLTIGYFADEASGQAFEPHLEAWLATFTEAFKAANTSNATIVFDSISLYGFTDMATFFKHS